MLTLAKTDGMAVVYEPDTDVILVDIIGRLELPDAMLITESMSSFVTDIVAARRPYYVLLDLRRATGASPASRKFFANVPEHQRPLVVGRRLVFISSSFAMQTLAKLTMKALALAKLFTVRDDDWLADKWALEADEAGARAWIRECQRSDRERAGKT